jgi:hypothetical protein
MADIVFNIAKGRVAELYNRVDSNDPANSALIIVPVEVGATTDATIRDFDTLAAVLAGGVTERSANGWNRKTLDDSALSAMTVDDTNDRMPLDFADQTWTPTSAGDTVSDLIICYDNDTTGGTDSNLIPLTMHDFVIIPDSSLVTALVTDFFRAS